MIRLVIQAGVILVVIAALPYKVFELDRYFVPKELVLHGAALIIALKLVARRRSLSFDLVDGLDELDERGCPWERWRPRRRGVCRS